MISLLFFLTLSHWYLYYILATYGSYSAKHYICRLSSHNISYFVMILNTALLKFVLWKNFFIFKEQNQKQENRSFWQRKSKVCNFLAIQLPPALPPEIQSNYTHWSSQPQKETWCMWKGWFFEKLKQSLEKKKKKLVLFFSFDTCFNCFFLPTI